MGSASLGPVSLSSKELVEKSAQSSPYREVSGNKTVQLAGRPEGTPAGSAGCCLLKSCSSRERDKITRWPRAALGISGVGKTWAGAVSDRGPVGWLTSPSPYSWSLGIHLSIHQLCFYLYFVVSYFFRRSSVTWMFTHLHACILAVTLPLRMHPQNSGKNGLRDPGLPEVGDFSQVIGPQGPEGAHGGAGSKSRPWAFGRAVHSSLCEKVVGWPLCMRVSLGS